MIMSAAYYDKSHKVDAIHALRGQGEAKEMYTGYWYIDRQ